MVKGEIITLGTAAAAIGGAYKFSEFLYKAKRLRDVGPANAVYVRIIGRVSSDLDEVRRLLSVREVHDVLEANPEKSKWVYGVMRDVRGALENMTPHTERVGNDVEEGRRIGLRHRVYWLISEQEKLENREKELVVAHASLSEVLGYLTQLEPVEEPRKPESKKETHVDVDVDVQRERGGQQFNERVERETWVEERHDAGPRRVEERREVFIERDHEEHFDRRGPRKAEFEERREVYVDERERGPQRYEERREVYVDERERERGPQRYEERREVYVDERERGPQRYEERDIHIERTRETREPRDARYEAEYDERYEEYEQYDRRPQYPEYPGERPREERPFRQQPPARRPESFEDRLPERETWMQSSTIRNRRPTNYGPYGEYAEYGAPQPVGAAHYKRRFQGDAGFGDEEILNPQPVPLDRKYADREVSELRYRTSRL